MFSKFFSRPKGLVLHVNSDPAPVAPERERVNLMALVNNSAIRVEMHNNRKHLVLPSYTLPDDVIMNGLLYPAHEIEKSYKGLEGTLAPLGHPEVNGKYVSATDAEAINSHHIGAWNRNVRREPMADGRNRVYSEKWVDVEYAANTAGGKRLLDRVDYNAETGTVGQPKGNIHSSTGIFLKADLTANGKNSDGVPYRGTVSNMLMDHDCILLDQPGAATPDQGVGICVNTLNVADAIPLHANDILGGQSYSRTQRLLSDAASAKWGGTDKFVWIEDFNDKTAIVRHDDRSEAVGYSITDGAVTWADSAQPVQQKTEWVLEPVVNRILQSLGLRVPSTAKPQQSPEANPDMDRKELDEALAANQTATLDAVKELLAPMAKGLTDLQANHKELADGLTANSRAAEADKRKVVAEKLGQAAADLLTGNALDEVHAKFVGAAPILSGFAGNSGEGFQKTALPE